MEGCLFCDIVSGKIPAYKIGEDSDHIAFLGIFPKFAGMTVVVTKQHFGGYLYETLSDEQLTKLHLFAKKIAKSLTEALGSMRCFQVMEGMEVDHAHVKLFPVYDGKYYGVKYESDNRATDAELKEVFEKIEKVGVNI